MPKLPEYALPHKRKGNNLIRSRNDNENWGACEEFRNLFPTSPFEGNGNQSIRLQPIREGIQDDLAQPSTSGCQKVLQNSSNKVGVSSNSFGIFGNNGFKENSSHERLNNLGSTTIGDNQNHCLFKSINMPKVSDSALGGRVYEDRLNFTSSHTGHHSSIVSSCFKNSLKEKSVVYRGTRCGNYFQPSKFSCGNNVLEPPQSFSMRKSVFNTDTFPKKYGIQGDFNIIDSRSQCSNGTNAFDCMTGTNALQRDSLFSINASRTAVDNQSLIKSNLQRSMVSMKEQIMNKLEIFGQVLLRKCPEMEAAFIQTYNDIKSILENSIFSNPVLSTTGISSLNSKSGVFGCPQQSIFQDETVTNWQQFQPTMRPILQNLQLEENENPKYRFIKSFTVNRMKEKNLNYEDDSFEANTISENFNTTSRKSDGKKELNLRNWYPVFQKNGLGLIGMNDENIQVETGTIKERINNRRLILENGNFCNLIGNPCTGKKFPLPISTRIKDGFLHNWKTLLEIMAKFQESTQKEKYEIVEGDVSMSAELETSCSSTVMTRSAAKLLKNTNVNNRKVMGREMDNFVTPKATKIKTKFAGDTLEQSKSCKSDGTKNKNENSTKKRSSGPVEKFPVKIQKVDSPKSATVGDANRTLCTTRSGRVVKRPKDVWIGSNFDENNTVRPEDINFMPTPNKGPENSNQEKEKKEQTLEKRPTVNAKTKKGNAKPKTKSLTSTINGKQEDIRESTVATRERKKPRKKVTWKSVANENSSTNGNDNSWGDGINGLDDICIPDISIHHEETISDLKKLKLLTMETPPLENIRNNLTFLKNSTPVQSPGWQVSQHSSSAVKKFEKLRAQTFKTKIPKECSSKEREKLKNPSRSNGDIDTIVNWISEREVRSPKKSSNVINYLMRKRNELEDEEKYSGDDDEEI